MTDVPKSVRMLSPMGDWQDVALHDVPFFSATGFKADTPELRTSLEQQAKFGDRPIAAAALGAAGGLSFGLAPLALDKTGLVPSETQRGLHEHNEEAFTAGELGSLAVPALGAVRALGTAGKVLRGVGAGIEGATAVGRGVEAAGEALGAGKLLPRALGISAEAELYNIGHNLSQAVEQDQDLTAETLLAHSENALALGAGLGLGVPALRRVGRELFDRVVPDVVKDMPRQAMDKIAQRVEKFFDPDRSMQLFAGAGGRPTLLSDSLKGQEFRRGVKWARENGVFRSGEVEADLANASTKQTAGGGLPDTNAAYQRVLGLQDDFGRGLADTLGAAEKAISDDAVNLAGEGDVAVRVPLKKLDELWSKDSLFVGPEDAGIAGRREAVRAKMEAGVKLDPPVVQYLPNSDSIVVIDGRHRIAEARRAGHDFMEVMTPKDNAAALMQATGGEISSGAWKVGSALEAKKVQNFVSEMRARMSTFDPKAEGAIRDEIDRMVSNGRIAEDAAAKLRGEIDHYADLLAAKQGSLTGLQDLKLGLSDRIRDMSKQAFLSDATAPAVDVLKSIRKLIKENIETGVEMIKAEPRYQGLAEQLAPIKKLNEAWGALESIREPLDMARARSESNVNVGGLRWRDLLASAVGSSAGAAVGGPVGAAIGGGVGFVNKFLQTDRGLLLRAQLGERFGATIGANGALSNAQKYISGAAERFVHGRGELGQSARRLVEMGDATIADAPKKRSVRGQFTENYEALSRVASDPANTAAEMAHHMTEVGHVSPELRDKVISKKIGVFMHLYMHAPKDPLAPMMMNPHQSNWSPSNGDIDKFNRRVRAATKPLSLLHDLKSKSVTPEAVDTVRELYPKLFEKMQLELMTQIGQATKQLPYQETVQLGILFGVPTDPSLSPQILTALLNQPRQHTDQSHSGGGTTGGKNRLADGMQTRAESLG